MSQRWQDQFKREAFERMAENIETAALAAEELRVKPLSLELNLRNAAYLLRLAIDTWPQS